MRICQWQIATQTIYSYSITNTSNSNYFRYNHLRPLNMDLNVVHKNLFEQCDRCGKHFNILPSSLTAGDGKLSRNCQSCQEIGKRVISFQCEQCGKSFLEKSALKRHIKTHTTEKAVKCNVCGKSISNKGALKNHVKIHTAVHW